jgi:hypothetical protein
MHRASSASLLSAYQTLSARSSWLSGHPLTDLFASDDARARVGSIVESFSSTGADHIQELQVQVSIEGSTSDLSDAQQVCLETADILHRVNDAVLMSIENSPVCSRISGQAKLNKADLSKKEEQQTLASGIDFGHVVGVERNAIRIGLDNFNFSERCPGLCLHI